MSGLIRLGFDEAGLGPTLGPLVVAGLATRTSGKAQQAAPLDDVREALAEVVGPPGVRDGRVELGDSKKIHAGTRKLARIERSALVTVAWVHGRVPKDTSELLELVYERSWEQAEDRRAPWWSRLDQALPLANEREELERAAERLREVADARGVEALWYRADVLSAARINRELAVEHAREGTKNTWATHAVLRLAAQALRSLEPARASVWCDKAGGRQAYEQPLRRAFPTLAPANTGEAELPLFAPSRQQGLEIVSQLRERSHYRLGFDAGRVDLGFVMKGDRLDPRISWGSILAKYLRELVLDAFNAHFSERIPGLRATAGYPEDAKRFIAEVRAALGTQVPESSAWIRSK